MNNTHYDFNLTGKNSHLSPVRLSKVFNPRSNEWSFYSEPVAPTMNYELKWERDYKDENSFSRAVKNYTKNHQFVRSWTEESV
jgi:hypothetical protein